MVKASRKAPGPGALRPLNLPEPLCVATRDGRPSVVEMRDGVRHGVVSVEDIWRVEEEWWRDSPIARTYFEVILDSGRRMTLFVDQAGKRWYSQRHG